MLAPFLNERMHEQKNWREKFKFKFPAISISPERRLYSYDMLLQVFLLSVWQGRKYEPKIAPLVLFCPIIIFNENESSSLVDV